jgi:hypothetical protein
MRNSTANQLGLPLASGQIAVFGLTQGERLFEYEAGFEDLAIGEELEINAGESADMQYRVVGEEATLDSRIARSIPLLPGWHLPTLEGQVGELERADITNARAASIEIELRLQLAAGEDVVRADHALHMQHGKPTFSVKIPARSTAKVRYQTRRTLTGTGTVGNAQIDAGGTFTPGSGTPGSSMNVSGNLALQAGGNYVVTVNPSTASIA